MTRLERIKQAHRCIKRKTTIKDFYSYLSKSNVVETISVENCERIDFKKEDVIQKEIMDQIFG